MTTRQEEERLLHKLDGKVKRAIFDYGLIEDGDRILVGLSGGKDSLALLELLGRRSRIFRPRFELVVLHVGMKNIPYQPEMLCISIPTFCTFRNPAPASRQLH